MQKIMLFGEFRVRALCEAVSCSMIFLVIGSIDINEPVRIFHRIFPVFIAGSAENPVDEPHVKRPVQIEDICLFSFTGQLYHENIRHCPQITSEICLSKFRPDCVVVSRRSKTAISYPATCSSRRAQYRTTASRNTRGSYPHRSRMRFNLYWRVFLCKNKSSAVFFNDISVEK